MCIHNSPVKPFQLLYYIPFYLINLIVFHVYEHVFKVKCNIFPSSNMILMLFRILAICQILQIQTSLRHDNYTFSSDSFCFFNTSSFNLWCIKFKHVLAFLSIKCQVWPCPVIVCGTFYEAAQPLCHLSRTCFRWSHHLRLGRYHPGRGLSWSCQ